MSDAILVALITAGSVIFVQLIALVVSNRKSDNHSKQLVEIHSVVNGNLSKVTAALDIANQKIEGLQNLVTSILADRKDAKKTKGNIQS